MAKTKTKCKCPRPDCGRVFTKPGDLNRHITGVHQHSRPHACPWNGCGKTFTQKSGLKTHYNTHTGEKPYTCNIAGCTKRFGDPAHLNRHRETHFDKRFKCLAEGCDATFSRKERLQRHLKGFHPDSDFDLSIYSRARTRRRSENLVAPGPSTNGDGDDEAIAAPAALRRSLRLTFRGPTPVQEEEDSGDVAEVEYRYHQAAPSSLASSSRAISSPSTMSPSPLLGELDQQAYFPNAMSQGAHWPSPSGTVYPSRHPTPYLSPFPPDVRLPSIQTIFIPTPQRTPHVLPSGPFTSPATAVGSPYGAQCMDWNPWANPGLGPPQQSNHYLGGGSPYASPAPTAGSSLTPVLSTRVATPAPGWQADGQSPILKAPNLNNALGLDNMTDEDIINLL